jgi:hypothetical protein
MLASTEESRTFDKMKADLLRKCPGGFALIAGSRLLGVFTSVDDAMVAASEAFDSDTLPPGAPIMISEIAEKVTVRVMATPQRKAVAAPSPISLRGLG